MNIRPRPTRSIPFWILVAGSAASLGYGLWLTSDKISVMTSTLLDGSASGVEVYAGQAWAVFAAAFVGAGLIGLVASLSLVVAASLFARPAPETEVADDEIADEPVDESVPVDEVEVLADDGVTAEENVPAAR
ncbi:dinucleotide-utilizing enzyme [Microbacterium sp. NPDC089189]|uniref:dinucleotide-utilizing enzyme n=1 Tax=Microbacterium sp. NPDC089189 TaxID=3154972 RepID=UPI003427F0C5